MENDNHSLLLDFSDTVEICSQHVVLKRVHGAPLWRVKWEVLWAFSTFKAYRNLANYNPFARCL